MTADLPRRLFAELLGACLLAATVIGSGILAVQLSAGNDGVALLGNTLATAAILYVLVGTLGPVSGTHFNPAVTLVIAAGYWWTSSTSFANPAITIARAFTDTFAGIRPVDAPGFIAAQIGGALLAWLAGGWLFGRKTA